MHSKISLWSNINLYKNFHQLYKFNIKNLDHKFETNENLIKSYDFSTY